MPAAALCCDMDGMLQQLRRHSLQLQVQLTIPLII
jgi:hypothetical protein